MHNVTDSNHKYKLIRRYQEDVRAYSRRETKLVSQKMVTGTLKLQTFSHFCIGTWQIFYFHIPVPHIGVG